MTLNELNTELSELLPRFKDGLWTNHSYERNGTVYMLLRHPDESHEYESNLSEHEFPIVRLLGMFDRY
jgi:hypothetical protein